MGTSRAIDRTFSVGDEVYFHEWNPDREMFTGRSLGPVKIIYVYKLPECMAIFTHEMPPNVIDQSAVASDAREAP